MSNEETTVGEPQTIVPEVIYQQDKALLDTQIVTAKAYPRNISKAIENAITTVTLDEEVAQTCTYSLPRGNKKITGPSVHLARILAQFWGNLRAESKVINIDYKQITSQAVAFDLETNVAIKVEVKKSITGKSGRYNDDMITVTGNAANAIAFRNAIFAIIPKGVLNKVYQAALDKILGDVSDENKLIAKRTSVMTKLKETYKVSEEEILSSINRSSVSQIEKDDLITLIGIGQAIKDGDTTIETAFKSGDKSKEDKVKDSVHAKTGITPAK